MADTPADGLSDQLRRALVAVRTMRAHLDAIEQDRREPIAIVGMSCRLPGGADTIEQYWALLTEGRSGITEVPASRWSLDAFYDPDPEAPGKMYSRYGGFVQDIDRFDPLFFGISPREAASMDPQQRLLLEVSWEALERAGQSPDRLKGSRTGVFVGISATDYATSSIRNGLLREIDAYGGTGGVNSVATGRLSYVLGLQGPNFAIDTACSGSLVAVHQAIVSLRSGESTLALAGGVNVTLLPESSVYFSKLKALAPDGRCKTFDAAADGYVRGEGCGMVVLKRLRDAVRDGDPVLAVIRGSAVNHDGRSNGLTAPNGVAQEAVIRDALAAAGLTPDAVDYVEAHGTGTALGDPIEVQALAATYGRDRDPQHRLILGSAKTNIGHLESAAGIAGLIKVVLAIQHAEIPPNLHFKRPSPLIAWHTMPCQVATARMPWPRTAGPRVAAVSSFGFSGTNAHVILEEAPATPARAASPHPPGRVLALSARSHEALRALAQRYHAFLATADSTGVTWPEVCHTAAAGRTHFEHRLALRGDAPGDVLAPLAAAADAGTGIVSLTTDDPAKVAFVFMAQTGGGSEPGPLYDLEPAFRDAWDAAQRAGAAALPGAARAYALARLWHSWGLVPAAVVADRDLAWVAAVLADALSLDEAVPLALAGSRTAEAFADAAARVTFRRPALRVLGRQGDGWRDITDVGAWLRARSSAGASADTSPDATLREFGVDSTITIGSGTTQWTTLLDELVRLYRAGARIDWTRANGGQTRLVTLPTYPFQRKRHWVPEPALPVHVAASDDPIRHPLLGRELNLAGAEHRFEMHVRTDRPAFIGDHRVFGGAIMPAAGFIEMMLAAGRDVYGTPQITVDDLAIQEALIVGEHGSVLQTSLESGGEHAGRCAIYSRPGVAAGAARDWHLHVGGIVGHHTGDTKADGIPPASPGEAGMPEAGMVPVPVEDLYSGFRARGIDYGPLCQGLQQLWGSTDGRAIGVVRLPDALAEEADQYLIHPVLLDSSLQVLAAAFVGALTNGPSDRVFLPLGVRRFTLHRRAGRTLRAHAHMDVAQLAGSHEAFTGDLRLLSDTGELIAEVDGLTWKHAGRERLVRREADDIATHFYTVSWTPQPLEPRAAAPPTPAHQRWVIWTDADSAVGRRLADRMTADGVTAAVVHDEDTLATALDAATAVAGVVYVRGVGRPASHGRATGLVDDVREQCDGLLRLIQRLASRTARPAVYIVTEDALGLGSAAERPPLHAPAWGLARTVATEFPELRCVCVDVSDAGGADATAERLWDEVRFGRPENQVALVGNDRRVARLVPVARETARRDAPVRPGRTYVISGGTRGLGWSIAERLLSQGADHLVLIGRRAPADDVRTAIDGWRARGVRLEVREADVADGPAVAALFDAIHTAWPPLAGVVHAAGILDDAVIHNQTWERFARVLGPKMQGAWNLHAATTGDTLDFFVLFSSMAAVFGAPGQSNYAAANAFLDSLARWRRRQGLPAASINWPAWSDIGLAANDAVERRMQGHGIRMLDVASGGRAFDLLAAGDRAQVLVLPVDWGRFLGATDGEAPLLAEIAQRARVTSGVPAELAGEVRAQFERALQRSPEHRRAAVAELIAAQVASILQFPADEPIDLRRPLDQFGLDSLMAVRLRNTLAAAAGRHLPITLIFDYPTIDAMAGYLADDVFGGRQDAAAASPIPVPPPPPADPEELPDLSEDELDSRIEALLNRHAPDAARRD